MDNRRLILVGIVTFLLGLVVGLFVAPRPVPQKAFESLQEENRLLRELNEELKAERDEVKRALEGQ